MKNKHPVYILVFGIVTSDGDIMPPFITPGLTLNPEADIKFLVKRMPVCIERVAAGIPYVSQQELSAMSHKLEEPVLTVRKFSKHTTFDIWPSNSSECNPLDY